MWLRDLSFNAVSKSSYTLQNDNEGGYALLRSQTLDDSSLSLLWAVIDTTAHLDDFPCFGTKPGWYRLDSPLQLVLDNAIKVACIGPASWLPMLITKAFRNFLLLLGFVPDKGLMVKEDVPLTPRPGVEVINGITIFR